MKFSTAMLKGFEKVGGKQCRDVFNVGPASKPKAVCVLGAIHLSMVGLANGLSMAGEIDNIAEQNRFEKAFHAAWGVYPQTLNDDDEMPWEHLYGMAVAAGL